MRIARGIFFPVQQFDNYCFRSVMKGLLQLSFELLISFCINPYFMCFYYLCLMTACFINLKVLIHKINGQKPIYSHVCHANFCFAGASTVGYIIFLADRTGQ